MDIMRNDILVALAEMRATSYNRAHLAFSSGIMFLDIFQLRFLKRNLFRETQVIRRRKRQRF
ncbi:hypothetical protein CW713_08105 [Methanophagales archaeon]|nr:MAG: hypothetical protein CW713_08105 [Methanophagales archaeon]